LAAKVENLSKKKVRWREKRCNHKSISSREGKGRSERLTREIGRTLRDIVVCEFAFREQKQHFDTFYRVHSDCCCCEREFFFPRLFISTRRSAYPGFIEHFHLIIVALKME
jgi:hypothetical protein